MALFIDVMFLFLGLSGIVLTYGLMTGKKWGYTGTIGISALTIVFDVWAIIAVQPTALLGLILPTVFIVYLVMRRNEFCFGLRSNERVGGVRN
jgi:putative exporter of polyketide antibiotics